MMLFKILLALAFLYCALTVVYLFVFSLAGRWPRRTARHRALHQRRMAVLIPGYKEDAVIVETARQALQQTYPHDHYRVVVIADSFQPETLATLRALPVDVLEVSFARSTKAKALNAALEWLPGERYDLCVVLDADNVMAADFLERVNEAFDGGSRVVQGRRVAKNSDTPMALLDAISEEINNHIFRKGHRTLGLSAALIGSGMAFEYALFHRLMRTVRAVGGFDKELELKLLRDGLRIDYLDEALVYDEKVQQAAALVPQRTRWLAAQGHYGRAYVGEAVRHLVCHGNLDFFNKAMQMLLPPRIVLVGLLPLSTILACLLGAWSWGVWWFALTALLGASLLLAIPARFYRKDLWRALAYLPQGFALMLVALLRSPTGNRTFLHTPHDVVIVASHPEHTS